MISQTITRWFGRLFSWWPWKRISMDEYTSAINSVNRVSVQETGWRMAANDGPIPLQGTATVAIEQEMGPPTSNTNHPGVDERTDLLSPLLLPPTDEVLSRSQEVAPEKKSDNFSREKPALTPTPEQQLAFLHFLVKKGTFNEGFSDEKIPDQYRKKHT